MAERPFVSLQNKDASQSKKEDVPDRKKHGTKIASRKKLEKTRGQKCKDLFFGDNLIGIGNYVLKDLIVPSIQDILLMFVEAALKGDRRSISVRSIGGGNNQKTDYNKLSSNRARTERSFRRDEERERERDERKALNLDNLVFSSREEANECLVFMMEYLEEYEKVPVAYLHELLGETGDYTAEYYGWRSLKRAEVRPSRGGYLLYLPTPIKFSD